MDLLKLGVGVMPASGLCTLEEVPGETVAQEDGMCWIGRGDAFVLLGVGVAGSGPDEVNETGRAVSLVLPGVEVAKGDGVYGTRRGGAFVLLGVGIAVGTEAGVAGTGRGVPISEGPSSGMLGRGEDREDPWSRVAHLTEHGWPK
jgi:hypothetical protein